MKINIPKKWFAERIEIEGDGEIGAGNPKFMQEYVVMSDPYLCVDTAIERLYNEWKKYGKIIIALDFDDTIYDFHKKGYAYPRVIELIKECQEMGCYVVIFTGSEPEKYPMIREYCASIGINADKINENAFPMPIGNNGKIYFNILLDDRAGLPATYAALQEVCWRIKGKI